MKQAIMIGAGNIGRGFIGAILSRSGYHVTFADVNMTLIDAINAEGSYTVHIQDIHTVCTVDRHTTSSRDKANDFITGNRIAAFGETDTDIMASFDHDRAFVLAGFCAVLILGHTL